MRLALYHPEIPQNTGTLLRLGACLGVPLDIIEPCGFALSDRQLKRAGMDYLSSAHYQRYSSWEDFLRNKPAGRLILLTPHASMDYLDFTFQRRDILILGSESTGVGPEVEPNVEASLKITLEMDYRSLNVAIAGAMVLGEALRQTGNREKKE